MSGERYAASPSPAASSSTLPSNLRIRLRIRPHSPLSTEPFVLPVNLQASSVIDPVNKSQDDLRFLAGKILGNLSHAPDELPTPTDLAMYLEGFRLIGWGTKLNDLVRDGDVIDVYHISRPPQLQISSCGASSTTVVGKKRKRQSTSTRTRDARESSAALSGDASSSSASHQAERPSRKSKKTHLISNNTSRHRETKSANLPYVSAIRRTPTSVEGDIQAEADRIALLIKSEIGARGAPARDGPGREGVASRAISPYPINDSHLFAENEAISSDHELLDSLRMKSGSSVRSPVAAASSKTYNIDRTTMPLPPPPSGGAGGAAAAMAAFEARKLQVQRQQRKSHGKAPPSGISEQSAAAYTASSSPQGGCASGSNTTFLPSKENLEQTGCTGNPWPGRSGTPSAPLSPAIEPTSPHRDGAQRGDSRAHGSGSNSSPSSSTSTSESDTDTDSEVGSDGDTGSGCSNIQHLSRLSPLAQATRIPTAKSQAPVPPLNVAETKHKARETKSASHRPSQAEWVPPGQGLARTKRTNIKRRQKLREIARANQERDFEEAQERARKREAKEIIPSSAAEHHVARPISEAQGAARADDGDDSGRPSEGSLKALVPRQIRRTDSPAASPQNAASAGPPVTIHVYEREESPVASDEETPSTLGWAIDVTPTTPLIPHKDPRAPIHPPLAVSSLTSIRSDLAKRERDMAELKEKIRKAEDQRRNLPPGGGMFDLSFAPEMSTTSKGASEEGIVPTANTQPLPTSSAVTSKLAQQSPVVIQRIQQGQPDAKSSLTTRCVSARGDSPPPAKKARTLRKSLPLPPTPSTLPASSIPANIRLTSVDCEAWYNGETSLEYLYVPQGQEKKGRASADDAEGGQSDGAEDEGDKPYFIMRRKLREELRKEKEKEEQESMPQAKLQGKVENGALHPDQPLTFSSRISAPAATENAPLIAPVTSSSRQKITHVSSAAEGKQTTTAADAGQAANAQAKRAVIPAVPDSSNGVVSIAQPLVDSLPTQFGTEKTRAKQQSGKSSRVQDKIEATTSSAMKPNLASVSTSGIELAYLGPPGTYSHQVSLTLDLPTLLDLRATNGVEGQENSSRQTSLVACSTITNTLKRALQGSGEGSTRHLALLPYANSTYGPVRETEALLTEYEGRIKLLAATTLRVQHALLVSERTYKALQAAGDIVTPATPGQTAYVQPSALAKIDKVHSHEQALGQCNLFLRNHLPLTSRPGGRNCVASTALAASTVAADGLKGLIFEAAIASEICANGDIVPGLRLLKAAIQDKDDNTTKFILIEPVKGAKASIPKTTKENPPPSSLPATAKGSVVTAPTASEVKVPSAAEAPLKPNAKLLPRPLLAPALPTVHPDFFPGTSSSSAIEPTDVDGSSNDPGGLDYGEPDQEERYVAPAANSRRLSSRPTKNMYATTKPTPTPTPTSTSTSHSTLKSESVPGVRTATTNGSTSTARPTLDASAPSSSTDRSPSDQAHLDAVSKSVAADPTTVRASLGLPDDAIKLARERALATLKRKKAMALATSSGSGTTDTTR